MESGTGRQAGERGGGLRARWRVGVGSGWTGWLVRPVLLLATLVCVVVPALLVLLVVIRGGQFFAERGVVRFLTTAAWYPPGEPASFGALALVYGSVAVVVGSISIGGPLGILTGIATREVLPRRMGLFLRNVLRALVAIPAVVYGFVALVWLAPLIQLWSGPVLVAGIWLAGLPALVLGALVLSELVVPAVVSPGRQGAARRVLLLLVGAGVVVLSVISWRLLPLRAATGTNALNVCLVLGVMSLPTIALLTDRALGSVSGSVRESAAALGATRVEALVRVVLPAVWRGLAAALLLGVARVVGETMVVWMAAGDAARIPTPFYDVLEPIRTITAAIAGDIGAADEALRASRYRALFALSGLLLLVTSPVTILAGRWLRGMRREG